MVLSIGYVLLAYICPFLWLFAAEMAGSKLDMEHTMNVDNTMESGAGDFGIIFLILVIPLFVGILNAIYLRINRERISRSTLLRCAILIKYLLIPLYLVGGLTIILFFLLTFIPVVFMVFVGPFMIALLSAYGYATMLGGSAFSVAYINKAKKEGIHGKLLSSLAKMFQFFFGMDVITMTVLTLKERKYVKSTIMVIVILLVGIIGIIGWLTMNILKVLM